MSSSIQYRPEIDGLRAISVLAVVAFHLGASWIPGGFVGVDVFFVISGFLITSIISRELAQGTFRLRDFWLRRARRILPALGAMLALTSAGGYLILIGEDYRFLGLQSVSALTFWANICMYRNAGNYWGPEAEDFSLLHCWSLSVEEQFYLLLPLAMLLLARKGGGRIKWILVAAAAASFGLALFGTRRYPAAAFYLLPTRAWELLIGSFLALGQDRLGSWISRGSRRALCADLGGLMVVTSFFVVRKGDWFPAPAGLLPTVGAAMLIGLGRDAGWFRRFLSMAPIVYLGRISYSWYLFHWPIIVLSRQVGFEEPRVLFAAGLVLAVVSYHWVEIPTRALPEGRVALRIVLPVALVGTLVLLIPMLGLRDSQAHDVPGYWCRADLVPWRKPWSEEPGCREAGLVTDPRMGVRRATPIPGPIHGALIGDSHAKSWLPALDTVFAELGWNYSAFPASGASPFFIPDGGKPDDYLAPTLWSAEQRFELDRNRRAFLTAHQPPIVVVGARWYGHRNWNPQQFRAGLSNLLVLLPKSQFLVIGQPPELPHGDKGFFLPGQDVGRWTRMNEVPSTHAARDRVHGWIREFAAQEPRVHFLETDTYFLNGDQVRLYDGKATLYRDDDHVSIEGAMRLTGVFRKALLECSKAAAPASPQP
jgi:peptidoglycan/LPS O-acetylase OafA/YrhL